MYKNSNILSIKMDQYLYNNKNNKLPLSLLSNILNPLLFTFNSPTPLNNLKELKDLQKSTLKNYYFLCLKIVVY